MKTMPRLTPLNKFRSLQEICEANYRKLLRLIPQLACLKRCAVARLGSKPALYLELKEKGPYTVTLELSYCLRHGAEPMFEPGLRLKVYLDVRMVEVVGDCELKRARLEVEKALEHKWLSNYFLSKWLDHCLYQGYRFSVADDPAWLEV
jgi:uncharacterized protein YqiB (DUF1249 family)